MYFDHLLQDMAFHKDLYNNEFIRRSKELKTMLNSYNFLEKKYFNLNAKYKFAKERHRVSKECYKQLITLDLKLQSTVLYPIKTNLDIMNVHLEYMGSLFPDIFMEKSVLEKILKSKNVILVEQFHSAEKKMKLLIDSFLVTESEFLRHCGKFTGLFLNVLDCIDSKGCLEIAS